jgi:hypothetical protein
VERGRKKMAPGDGDSFRPLFLLVPAKAGILLPLEKGLGGRAFALDPAIKRLGPEPSAAARAARRRKRSERVPVGAAFSVPFWPVKKGTSRRGIPAGWLQKGRSSCMFFTEPLGTEPSGGGKGWWPMRLATASTGRSVSPVVGGVRVWFVCAPPVWTRIRSGIAFRREQGIVVSHAMGHRFDRADGVFDPGRGAGPVVQPADAASALHRRRGQPPGPVRSLRIGRASRAPCHRCTGTASSSRIANRPFPHLQPSVSTNSQGSPGGDL